MLAKAPFLTYESVARRSLRRAHKDSPFTRGQISDTSLSKMLPSSSKLWWNHQESSSTWKGNPDNGIEANGYPGFLTLVSQAHPDQCTLVPDTNDQLTSNHGWDLYVEDNRRRLVDYIEELHSNNIRVSIFLDPDVALVEHAATIGIDRIELYTGPWVECVREQGLNSDDANKCLHLYTQAADRAYDRGLKVNAGHDLDLENLRTFASRVKVDEVSIGHALISDALFYGLTATVEKYLDRLSI